MKDLENRIDQDLKTAMKNKDKKSLRALRAIKSQILLHKTSGSGESLDETQAMSLLQKQAKQREESIEIYEKQNRDDLAEVEREELEVIKRYLPEEKTEEEIREEIRRIINDQNAESMKDMGDVMREARKRLQGQDGSKIASIVKDELK